MEWRSTRAAPEQTTRCACTWCCSAPMRPLPAWRSAAPLSRHLPPRRQSRLRPLGRRWTSVTLYRGEEGYKSTRNAKCKIQNAKVCKGSNSRAAPWCCRDHQVNDSGPRCFEQSLRFEFCILTYAFCLDQAARSQVTCCRRVANRTKPTTV